MTTLSVSNTARTQRQILQALTSIGSGVADFLPSKNVRILSIGNSRIGTNTTTLTPNIPIPRMFPLFLNGLSYSATWADVTVFGVGLTDHWGYGNGSGTARAAIRSKQYTHIILQDLSSNSYTYNSDFVTGHALFASEIAKYNPGAKILLWQNNALSDDAAYATTMVSIENNYRVMAEIMNADIIPVGRTWNNVRISPGFATLPLYKSGDNAHPAIRGIYLNCACVFETLFKTNPNISTTYIPSGMTSAETLQLNNIAYTSLAEPMTAVTVTEVNVAAGKNLGKFRRLDIYLSSINWNNGSSQVTVINDKNDPVSSYTYPTMPINGWFLYQTGETASSYRIVSADTIEKTQTFYLDSTKDTWLSTNDGNFANNTGSIVANIRTYS